MSEPNERRKMETSLDEQPLRGTVRLTCPAQEQRTVTSASLYALHRETLSQKANEQRKKHLSSKMLFEKCFFTLRFSWREFLFQFFVFSLKHSVYYCLLVFSLNDLRLQKTNEDES